MTDSISSQSPLQQPDSSTTVKPQSSSAEDVNKHTVVASSENLESKFQAPTSHVQTDGSLSRQSDIATTANLQLPDVNEHTAVDSAAPKSAVGFGGRSIGASAASEMEIPTSHVPTTVGRF